MKIAHSSRRGLRFTKRGSGQPMLLVHGWCLNRNLWTYEEVSSLEGFEVITPDMAGFGQSSDLDGPYDLDRHADDLLDLLEELEIENVIVVGFAFGAGVAMRMAAQDGSRIDRVVSIGVPSKDHSPYTKMPRSMRRDWPEFAFNSAVAICSQPQSDHTISWLAGMFGGTQLPVAIETVGVLAQFDPTEHAAEIQVPILYVHGEDDPVVPVAVSRKCAELSPEGELLIIVDSGHLVPIDQPESLHESIVGFAGSDEFVPAVD